MSDEAGIRRLAATFRVRQPWRGDSFTLTQVECLLGIIDGLRTECAAARAEAVVLREELAFAQGKARA